MSKYLVINPMNEQIEENFEAIRRMTASHCSKGDMEAMKVNLEHMDYPAHIESIDEECALIEIQSKRIFHAVIALMILAAVDISLHWFL